MLQIGSLLDNKYKILSEIGHGGMSVVYLAINERANKTWAIKEVRKDGVTDFEAVRQGLVVETDMLKKLRHPHLPSIIDVIDTQDSFLIVMDYIEGTSLQKRLKSSGAQPEEYVVRWGKQLCDVLGYLHSQNPPIIYRDMKPANVMLKPDGNVTLIDFGTAREFKNKVMVEDTTCLGTRGYAAPEQFGGRGQTDPRTDIYNLGATLYHLLTGHSPTDPPFEIKPISYWLPQYAGSGLEKVLLKCTQQDPSERYQNCAELMYALQHYKDEDEVVQASRRRKWRGFLAAAIAGVIGLGCTIGFSIALNNAKTQTYDSYVEQAEEQADFDGALGYYTKAINLDSGRPEAYESLVLDNRISSADQFDKVSKLLNQDQNIDKLKKDSPETWAQVQLWRGLYTLFYSKDDLSNPQLYSAASVYFGSILDSDSLDDNQQLLVQTLYQLKDIFATKPETGKNDDDTADPYRKLLEIINSDDPGMYVGGIERYQLKLYNLFAFLIWQNLVDFYQDEIRRDDLTAALDKIETDMRSMGFAQTDELYKEVQDRISNARQRLESN